MREDIKAYIDGELSPERAEEVRQAIEADPELMEEYLSMKQLTESLQAFARQPQVKGVEQTMKALAPMQGFRWTHGLATAAAFVLIAALVYPLFAKARSYSGPSTRMAETASTPRDMESAAKAATADVAQEQAPTVAGNGALMDSSALFGDADVSARRTESSLPGDDALWLGRLIVKDATLVLRVQDVQESIDRATNVARSLGGYVEASTLHEPDTVGMFRSGYLTLRLPQERFEEALGQLGRLGDVRSRNISGDDVTERVSQIESRLATLRAEEQSLQEILLQASKVGDVLEVKDRISGVRQQIESYQSQSRTLTRLSSLATVSLTVTTDKKTVQPVEDERDGSD